MAQNIFTVSLSVMPLLPKKIFLWARPLQISLKKHLRSVIETFDRECFRHLTDLTSNRRPDDEAARKLWKFITGRHQQGFWESQRKNGINWKRKSEKKRGEGEKGKREEKARLLWSVARCLCGLYISAFRRNAKQGRGTHTHTHTQGPQPFSNRRHTSSSPPCGYESSETRKRAPSVFLDF